MRVRSLLTTFPTNTIITESYISLLFPNPKHLLIPNVIRIYISRLGLPYPIRSTSPLIVFLKLIMPVISESGTGLHDFQTTYLVFGILFLFLLGLCISRKDRSSNAAATSASPISEKGPYVDEVQTTPIARPTGQMPRPPQPPPLTPPTTFYEGGGGEAQTYYSPTEISGSFDSFEPVMEMEMSPRRRSYTKTTAGGGEVSGEIIVAEGWRRHTRVFGGGVCEACVESERKMAA